MKDSYKIDCDIAIPDSDSASELMNTLEDVCNKFNLIIIGFNPNGPGGGNPCVTFYGQKSDLKNMIINWYMSEDNEAESWFNEFSENC